MKFVSQSAVCSVISVVNLLLSLKFSFSACSVFSVVNLSIVFILFLLSVLLID